MHIKLALATLTLPLSGLANFHIGTKVTVFGSAPNPPTSTRYIACPSNHYNCDCFGQTAGSDHGVFTLNGKSIGSVAFSLLPGLCGMGQLNFYYNSDKKAYDFYVNDGDGKVKGTCYPNKTSDKYCPRGIVSISQYTDGLVCYSSICGE